MLGSLVTTANVECLRTDIPTRWGLRLFDLGEELLEDPLQFRAVLGAEDFGDKRPIGGEELGGQLQRRQDQLVLAKCVLHPSNTNIWRAIMDHRIRLPARQISLDLAPAGRRGDVVLEADDSRNRLDGRQIDPHNQALRRHRLRRHLQPGAGGGAQIEQAFGGLQEGVLLVELDQLEGGARTIALLLGEVVVLVQPRLGVFLLNRHAGVCEA